MRDGPRNIVCRIRPPNIEVLVNGITVVAWSGDPKLISVGTYANGVSKTNPCIGTDYFSNVRAIAFEGAILAAPLPIPSRDAIETASAEVKQRVAELPNDSSLGARKARAINCVKRALRPTTMPCVTHCWRKRARWRSMPTT